MTASPGRFSRLTTERKVQWGFGVALCGLLIIAALAWSSVVWPREAAAWRWALAASATLSLAVTAAVALGAARAQARSRRATEALRGAHDLLAQRDRERTTELDLTYARAIYLASFPEKNPNPIFELDTINGAVWYTNLAARGAFPELAGGSLRPELLADLLPDVQTEVASFPAVVRREIEVGALTFALTITQLRESKRMRVYGSDVTARRAAERLAERQRAELELIFDSVPALIFYKDTESRLLRVNGELARLVGLPKEQLEGRTDAESGSPYAEQHRADDLAVLQTGQPVRKRAEQIFTTRGHRWVETDKIPHRNEKGEIIGIIGFAVDTTEQRRANLERDQLVRLIEHSSDFIAMANLDGRLTFMNAGARRMIGFAAEADLGTLEFVDYVPEKWQSFFRDTVIRTALEQGVWEGEMQLRHLQTGALVEVFRSTFLLRDAAGQPAAFATVTRDITEAKRSAVELRESEERLHAITENFTEGLIVAELDGRLVHLNRAGKEMHGLLAEQSNLGTLPEFAEMFELTTEDGRLVDFADWPLNRVLRGEVVKDFEVTVRRTDDGAQRILNYAGEIVRRTSGQPLAYLAVTDLTLRRQTERALREREAQLHETDRRLAEIVHGMTEACFALDAEWRFTFVNDRGETLLRHSRGEMLGRSIWEVFHQLVGTPMEQKYRCAMTERRPVEFEVFSPVAERWLDIRLFPTGEGLAAFLLDIQARKQAEETLRASEDQFRTMANSIPQLAWMAYADGFIFWYNRRWHDYTGTTPAQMEGWGWQSVHDPAVLPRVMESWQGAIATGQPFEMEFPLRGSDGRFRTFLTRVQPLRNAQGVVTQWFGTNTDVDEMKRLESSLRDTQSRLNSTLEAGSIGTWTWDLRRDLLTADEYTAQIFSIEKEAAAQGLPAEGYLRAVLEADRPSVAESLQRAIVTCGRYDIEYRIRQATGELRWIQARGRVEGDAAGEALHFHGAVMDITERRRVEDRFRRLVESNAQGVLFWNARGEITGANDAFLSMVGYTREDLEAGRICWRAMTPPEYAASDARSLAELAAHGVCAPTEKEYFRKDGSRLPILYGAATFEDRPDEGVCFILDITERRRTDRALRESEEYFRFLNDLSEATRMLADPAQIMAVTARMLGEHLHASRCAYADVEADGERFTILHDYTDGCASTVGDYHLSLFGPRAVETLYGGQTLIIRHVDAELPPGEGAEMFRAIGIQAIITCPLVKQGGLRAMMAVHQAEPRDWQKSEISMVQDVVERCWSTIERRTAEEQIRQLNADLENRVLERTAQLEAANKELESFSYSISHDLRSPLRAVDGFSRAVVEDFGPLLPQEGLRYLQTIRQGAQRMGMLIDDLLTFSRLSRLPLQRRKVETGQLVRDTIEDLALARAGREIEIRTGELPPCWGDPSLLRQVWTNLLANAFKYTLKQRAPVVEIGSEVVNGERIFVVRDNGAGFDMRYVGKLFGVFQRLHRAEDYEGTGVGLAIVQRIIHRHGGRVWAEGEEGRGATFYFTLEEERNPT